MSAGLLVVVTIVSTFICGFSGFIAARPSWRRTRKEIDNLLTTLTILILTATTVLSMVAIDDRYSPLSPSPFSDWWLSLIFQLAPPVAFSFVGISRRLWIKRQEQPAKQRQHPRSALCL